MAGTTYQASPPGLANHQEYTFNMTERSDTVQLRPEDIAHLLTLLKNSPTTIQGFYIPSVRRLVFVRNFSGAPGQFYSAWVSSNGLQIGGQFNVWTTGAGASTNGVDFNFSAAKASDSSL